MNTKTNPILVIALGNDIMGDDAAGLEAARILEKNIGSGIDIFEIASAGFRLLDVMEGYEKVLLLDSVQSNNGHIGEIRELDKKELMGHYSGSPHYTGLPEIIEFAGRLDIKFPGELKALVIEIENDRIIREGLSPDIEKKIPQFAGKALDILKNWQN
ncbi:MAG: hydrogenase maturation protease [Ignavibacteria bacterium]|nr:hydrogenase maturation protease [Ignavibacteria bacterium]MCC7158751.1 hydrogenase maturation protease [Ignavibacteria bacterium]